MHASGGFTWLDVPHEEAIARRLLAGHAAAEPAVLDRLRWNLSRFRGCSDESIAAAPLSPDDALHVVARIHHFDRWAELIEYTNRVRANDPAVVPFEQAADAIVTGELDALRALLAQHPTLIHHRSTRSHRSTLLHYVAANGFEDERQITPVNILDITTCLLDAGANVNATSEAYGGGSTVLGLVSTSAHPRAAGVQTELIDLLLARGALLEGEDTLPQLVRAALANGCPEAAVVLASRGVHVNSLFAAAGAGDLAKVRRFAPTAREHARESALIVAAQQGHRPIVEYLLELRTRIDANNGMTALHMASAWCHLDLMTMLIARGAPLEALNEYGGTVLSSTVWFAYHVLDSVFSAHDYPQALALLVREGARTDAYPALLADIEGVTRRAQRLDNT